MLRMACKSQLQGCLHGIYRKVLDSCLQHSEVKKTSYSVLQINYLQNLHKWLTNTLFTYIMNSVNIYFIWFYIKCVQPGFGRSYIQHHISRFRLRWLRHSSFICWCNSVCHSVMAVLRQRMSLRLRIEIFIRDNYIQTAVKAYKDALTAVFLLF